MPFCMYKAVCMLSDKMSFVQKSFGKGATSKRLKIKTYLAWQAESLVGVFSRERRQGKGRNVCTVMAPPALTLCATKCRAYEISSPAREEKKCFSSPSTFLGSEGKKKKKKKERGFPSFLHPLILALFFPVGEEGMHKKLTSL